MAQSKQQKVIVQGNPHRIGGGWADARQGALRSSPCCVNMTAAFDAEIAASGLQQGPAAYLWALVLRQLR